jgi:PAS domain S-box-containing protein
MGKLIDLFGKLSLGAVFAASGLALSCSSLNEYTFFYEHRPLAIFFTGFFTLQAGLIAFLLVQKRLDSSRGDILRKSEARYRNLFENMSTGFALHEIILDDRGAPADYRFLEVNSTFENLTGFPAEKLVGKTARETFPGIEKSHIDICGNVALLGEPCDFESYFADIGKYYQTRAYCPEQGKFALVIADVTERKLAETALRKSEESLREAQRMASIGSWELDLFTGKMIFSGEVYRILELPPDSSGSLLELFLGRIHPEDKREAALAFNKSVEERKPYDITHRVLLDDGRTKYIHQRGETKYDEKGIATVTVGTIQDISERIKSEQALRERERQISTLMDNLPAMVYRCRNEKDWPLAFASTGSLELTGYSPADFIGRKVCFNDIILQEDREGVWNEVQKSLSQRRKFEITYRINTADGEIKWVRETGQGVFDSEGKVISIEGICSDVTERRKINDTLRFIAMGGDGGKGENFLDALVKYLCETLGMECAFVHELIPDTKRARTAAIFLEGRKVKDFEYALAGTPNEIALGLPGCTYPKGIGLMFPHDGVIERMGAECYSAVSLLNSAGKPFGLVGVMGKISVKNPELVESVLRIVAVRVAQELEHRQNSIELKNYQEHLEQLVDERTHKLAMVLESGHFDIWTWDSSSDMLVTTPSAGLRTKGIEVDGSGRTKRVQFFAMIHPEDLKMVQEAAEAAIRGDAESWSAEFRYFNERRGWFWVSAMAQVVERGSDGRATKAIGLICDITDRKKTETVLKEQTESLNAIFDSAPLVLMLLKEDGSVEKVNQVGASLTDSSKEDLIGKYPGDVLGCAGVEEGSRCGTTVMCGTCLLRKNFDESLADKVSFDKKEINLRLVRKGAVEERNFLMTSAWVNLSGGERVLVSLDDITEQKRMGKAILEAMETAETANKAKNTFLAKMSHEIRTPMNAILGYSQLMQKLPEMSETGINYSRIISQSGEHLLSLINDILEMAKIEAGYVKTVQEAFSFTALMDEVETVFSFRAKEKGISLAFHKAENLPEILVSDQKKIRQVLINILGNSLKFTRQGRIDVNVGFKGLEGDKVKVKIDISDTGAGISKDEIGKVFSPFEQTKSGIDKGGTGLGMSISRQYALMLDGDLTIESEENLWTTVHFTFKAKVLEKQSCPTLDAQALKIHPGIKKSHSDARILVADDLDMNRQLLSKILERAGFAVKTAEDGFSAIEAFKSWRPDIILMDRRMPEMDGLEAASKIRTLPDGNAVRIILVTASDREDGEKEYLEAGIDGFIGKPFTRDEIIKEVERLLPSLPDEPSGEPFPPAARQGGFDGEASSLPENLVEELKALIEIGDATQFISVVEKKVRPTNQELGDYLLKLVERYDYSKIMSLLSSKGTQ